jgi:hypothetical protein
MHNYPNWRRLQMAPRLLTSWPSPFGRNQPTRRFTMEKNNSMLTVAPTQTKRTLRLNSESLRRLTVAERTDGAPMAFTNGFNCSHPAIACN